MAWILRSFGAIENFSGEAGYWIVKQKSGCGLLRHVYFMRVLGVLALKKSWVLKGEIYMKKHAIAIILGCLVLAGGAAQALTITDTFDTISSAWEVDRYTPDAFVAANFDGDNRLLVSTGTERSTNSWYWYEGMQQSITGVDVPWLTTIELYIPTLAAGEEWEATLWTRDSNPVENNSNYPIIGATTRRGTGALHWTVWDSQMGWIDLSPVTTATNQWYTLGIASYGDRFEYFVDGAGIYTDFTGSTAGYADLQTVFIEGRDFGTQNPNNVYWDNLKIGDAPNVPEPASMTMLGLGLAGMFVRSYRKRK